MKHFELENIGVQELSSTDLKKINGGLPIFAAFFLGFLLGALLGGMVGTEQELEEAEM